MPKKSKKSENELADGYKERLKRTVNHVDKLLTKIAKGATSRKYPLTESEKDKILAYLAQRHDVLTGVLISTGPIEIKGFEFDK